MHLPCGQVASMLKFAGEVAPQLMPRDVADHPTFLASDAQTQIMHTSLYYQVGNNNQTRVLE